MTPSTLAVLLGLTSAVSLAAVNAVVKAGRDILMGRVILSVTAAILVLPAAFFVPLPSGPVWIALLFSMLAHGAYQCGLINALSRGDLSVVFPIMRVGAPILVAVAAVGVPVAGGSFSREEGNKIISSSSFAFMAVPPLLGLVVLLFISKNDCLGRQLLC